MCSGPQEVHTSLYPSQEGTTLFFKMSKQSPLLQAALLCRVVQEGMQPHRPQMSLAVKGPDQFLLIGSGEIRNKEKDYTAREYNTR